MFIDGLQAFLWCLFLKGRSGLKTSAPVTIPVLGSSSFNFSNATHDEPVQVSVAGDCALGPVQRIAEHLTIVANRLVLLEGKGPKWRPTGFKKEKEKILKMHSRARQTTV